MQTQVVQTMARDHKLITINSLNVTSITCFMNSVSYWFVEVISKVAAGFVNFVFIKVVLLWSISLSTLIKLRLQ